MILQEINHKMPIYKDCTLGELLAVGAVIFISEIAMLSSLSRILFGFAAIGAVLTFLSFYHLTQYSLTYLQKVKYDKPYGYYKQLFVKQLSERKLIPSPYVTRIGKWSVRRML